MSRALWTQVRALRLLGAWLIGMAAMGAQAQGNSPSVSVAITTPGNAAVIAAPGAVALSATASVNLPNWPIREVAFYSGSTLIGISTSAPYGISWSAVPAGTYMVTARAIATAPVRAQPNPGTPNLPTWTGVSAPVSFRVNAPPTVSLAAPAAGAVFNPPASITVTANAADSDGTVANVDFYQGTTLIGTATAAPYSVSWANHTPGLYSLTARATDNDGALTTSNSVALRVNAPPTVSINSPANGAVLNQGANITITANAADTDGTVAMVDFYQGATLVGTATSAPYSFTLTGVAAGTYNLRAVATDNDGASTISPAVSVRVNAPPTVSLTSPASGASFTAPAAVNLAATAGDVDGTIARVEFWQGATLLATVNSAPYTYAWNSVAAGSYSLTAQATDNNGAVTTSAAVSVTVTSGIAQIYFIQVDHLNTPRLIADAAGTTVWRWDQQEPFGNNQPDENPSSLGAFEFDLRFPGQYFNKETGLFYNYYRDYDASIGRYIESDPIGLRGGINTYAYVENKPLSFVDPLGLFSGQVHNDITRGVARQSCPKLAGSLPITVEAVDSQTGYQLPTESFRHGMCEPGESASQGMTRTEEFIDREISKCTASGLANALHAGQDKHSPSHRGCQTWAGRDSMTTAQLTAHANADRGQSGGVSEARTESAFIIARFKARCPCQCE